VTPHPLQDSPNSASTESLAKALEFHAGLTWEPPVPWGRYGRISWGVQRFGAEALRVESQVRGLCVWQRLSRKEARIEGLMLHRAFETRETLLGFLQSVSAALGQRGVETVELEPPTGLEPEVVETLHEAGFFSEPGESLYRRSQARTWRARILEPALRAAPWLAIAVAVIALSPRRSWRLWSWGAAFVGLSAAAGVLQGAGERLQLHPWLRAFLGPLILTPIGLALFLQARFSYLAWRGRATTDALLEQTPDVAAGALPAAFVWGVGFGLASLSPRGLSGAAAGAVVLWLACFVGLLAHSARYSVALLLGASFLYACDRVAAWLAAKHARRIRLEVRRAPGPT
jgi:hypothetical protein